MRPDCLKAVKLEGLAFEWLAFDAFIKSLIKIEASKWKWAGLKH